MILRATDCLMQEAITTATRGPVPSAAQGMFNLRVGLYSNGRQDNTKPRENPLTTTSCPYSPTPLRSFNLEYLMTPQIAADAVTKNA